MIVDLFDKRIYNTIWTGGVDRLVNYDTNRKEWTVIDIATNTVRTHMTVVECKNLSTCSIPYSKNGRLDAIVKLLESNIPLRVIGGIESYLHYNQIIQLVKRKKV